MYHPSSIASNKLFNMMNNPSYNIESCYLLPWPVGLLFGGQPSLSTQRLRPSVRREHVLPNKLGGWVTDTVVANYCSQYNFGFYYCSQLFYVPQERLIPKKMIDSSLVDDHFCVPKWMQSAEATWAAKRWHCELRAASSAMISTNGDP